MIDTMSPAVAGREAAARNAENQIPGWQDAALNCLRTFARTNDRFMAEKVREWAHTEAGLPLPPSARAWGSVMVRASKLGLIVADGVARSKLPPRHSTFGAIWRSLVRDETTAGQRSLEATT